MKTARDSLSTRLLRRLRRLLHSRDEHAETVGSLRTRIQADASIAAILVARVHPHGYFIEVEVVQRQSGELWSRARGGVSVGEFSPFERHSRTGTIDLVAEFPRLRQEVPLLRAELQERARQGRFGTLYLAVGDDAEWMVCRYPGLDEPRDGTVRDRLWRLALASGRE